MTLPLRGRWNALLQSRFFLDATAATGAENGAARTWRPRPRTFSTPADGDAMLRSVIAGTGSYLPEKVLTNDDLAAIVDTSDEWIRTRTGIRQRHVAAEGENTSDLATQAAEAALQAAGLKAGDVDAVLVATTTPDYTFPATACIVQANLGVPAGAMAFDLQAVCSGFIYGLTVADSLIRAGQVRNVLLIGAETLTRLLDWADRSTCVLFGDGAGAVVLRGEEGQGSNADRGVLHAVARADGRYRELLHTDGGPSATGTVGKLRMQGREVFRHAVARIAEAMEEVMEQAGVSAQDIDLFVPHQANVRILDATARKLGIAPEKVMLTIAEHGNTSAASIPLALDAAVRQGRAGRGDLLLLEAMGGGFTWGAALLRL